MVEVTRRTEVIHMAATTLMVVTRMVVIHMEATRRTDIIDLIDMVYSYKKKMTTGFPADIFFLLLPIFFLCFFNDFCKIISNSKFSRFDAGYISRPTH